MNDSVLDVGCGPGSITAGFRKYVGERGRVVGVDREVAILEDAKKRCSLPTTKADIQLGDVYSLKTFSNGEFSMVHCHQVLQHLTDPVRALKEMKRVSNKYVIAREVDYETWTWHPKESAMDEWKRVYQNVARTNKADPNIGRRLKDLFAQAGIPNATIYADVVSYTTPQSTLEWGETWAKRISETKLADQAIEFGLSTKQRNVEMAQGWRRWAKSENACLFYIDVTAIGEITF